MPSRCACCRGNVTTETADPAVRRRADAARATLAALDDENAVLDAAIAALADEMVTLLNDSVYKDLAYVTHAELRDLPLAQNSTVLAVELPVGSVMSVYGACASTGSWRRQPVVAQHTCTAAPPT